MESRSSALTRRGLIAAGLGAGAAGIMPVPMALADRSSHPWGDLARSISGEVVMPGEATYLPRATPSALAYLQHSPEAIVVPRIAADVAATIRFARAEGLVLRVRGGGHSYAGYSTTDGILLDMSAMRQVEFDAGTGTVAMGGGVRGLDALEALRGHDHWIPAGNCTGVGLAGFFQGGGFGFYQRRYGLGCDSVVEADLVTATGQSIRVSELSHPDLLWALRGGGGGNFGVVTSFRMRAFPTDGPSSVAMVIWRGLATAPLVRAIAEMIDGTGDDLTWHFTCDATSPDNLGGTCLPQVTLMCHGFTGSARIESALSGVLDRYPPSLSIVRELSFWQSHDFLGGNHLPENGLWYVKSCFLPGPLGAESIDVLTRAAATWPGSSIGRSGTGFVPWNGRVTEVAADETAFVHRTPGYLAVIQTCWGNQDPPEVVEAGRQWAERTYEQLQPLSDGGSYQNWIDPDLADPLRAYYGTNLPRLIEAKSAVDPEDFFALPQGIPVRPS